MSFSRNIARALAVFGALFLVGAASAQTATQTATTTVAASNTLSLTAGGSLTFTPTVGTPDVDATTTLDFGSNDGQTYKITVVADLGGWAFTPSVTGKAANAYPVLRFVSATSTAGTPSTTAASLISSTNGLGAAAPVVTAITNASGTATVTLDVSVSQTVVAGSYAAGLTYTLATP